MTQIFSLFPSSGAGLTSHMSVDELETGYSLTGGTVTPKTLTVDEDASLSDKANVDDVVLHSQALAENDVLVGSGSPVGHWDRKSIADFRIIFGAQPSGIIYGTLAFTSEVSNFPAANRGDAFIVDNAGWIGGVAGTGLLVAKNDILTCSENTIPGTFAAVGSLWVLQRTSASNPISFDEDGKVQLG